MSETFTIGETIPATGWDDTSEVEFPCTAKVYAIFDMTCKAIDILDTTGVSDIEVLCNDSSMGITDINGETFFQLAYAVVQDTSPQSQRIRAGQKGGFISNKEEITLHRIDVYESPPGSGYYTNGAYWVEDDQLGSLEIVSKDNVKYNVIDYGHYNNPSLNLTDITYEQNYRGGTWEVWYPYNTIGSVYITLPVFRSIIKFLGGTETAPTGIYDIYNVSIVDNAPIIHTDLDRNKTNGTLYKQYITYENIKTAENAKVFEITTLFENSLTLQPKLMGYSFSPTLVNVSRVYPFYDGTSGYNNTMSYYDTQNNKYEYVVFTRNGPGTYGGGVDINFIGSISSASPTTFSGIDTTSINIHTEINSDYQEISDVTTVLRQRFDIMTKDSLRQSVESLSDGRTTIIYDDKGYPSYMNVIPKMKNSEIYDVSSYDQFTNDELNQTNPAFIIQDDNGETSEVDYILLSQYPCDVIGDTELNKRAVSLPGRSIAPIKLWDRDTNTYSARNYCENKGPNWHMMNMYEFSMLNAYAEKNNLFSDTTSFNTTNALFIMKVCSVLTESTDIYHYNGVDHRPLPNFIEGEKIYNFNTNKCVGTIKRVLNTYTDNYYTNMYAAFGEKRLETLLYIEPYNTGTSLFDTTEESDFVYISETTNYKFSMKSVSSDVRYTGYSGNDIVFNENSRLYDIIPTNGYDYYYAPAIVYDGLYWTATTEYLGTGGQDIYIDDTAYIELNHGLLVGTGLPVIKHPRYNYKHINSNFFKNSTLTFTLEQDIYAPFGSMYYTFANNSLNGLMYRNIDLATNKPYYDPYIMKYVSSHYDFGTHVPPIYSNSYVLNIFPYDAYATENYSSAIKPYSNTSWPEKGYRTAPVRSDDLYTMKLLGWDADGTTVKPYILPRQLCFNMAEHSYTAGETPKDYVGHTHAEYNTQFIPSFYDRNTSYLVKLQDTYSNFRMTYVP